MIAKEKYDEKYDPIMHLSKIRSGFSEVEIKTHFDVLNLFDSDEKIELFFNYLLYRIFTRELNKYERGEIDILPIAREKVSNSLELYIVDFNYLVLVIASLVKEFSLGDEDIIIRNFGITSDSKNKKNNKFLSYFFEEVLNICYINSIKTIKKYIRPTSVFVYENEYDCLEFDAIPFVRSSLKTKIKDEKLLNEFDRLFDYLNMKQVAFGAKCQTFWEENSNKEKRYFYSKSEDIKAYL